MTGMVPVASHGTPEMVVTLVRPENFLRPVGHVSYLEISILAGLLKRTSLNLRA